MIAIDTRIPTSLRGSAWLDTIQMDKTNVTQTSAFKERLQEILATEVRAFGLHFNVQSFDRLIQAVKTGKAYIRLMAVNCEPWQRHCIGAAILFPSAVALWNDGAFNYYVAQYLEDICVSSSLLMRFIRATGARLPGDMKLGAYLVGEIIRASAAVGYVSHNSQHSSRSLIAEYSPKNNGVSAILDVFNAKTGSVEDSGVLELLTAPSHGDTPVRMCTLSYSGRDDTAREYSNVFSVECSEGNQGPHVVATFTSGISSFTGESIVRIQVVSNACYSSEGTTEAMVRSLIAAGCSEIERRGWRSGTTEDRSPMRMRIHMLNEPQIRAALLRIGAVPRLLGPDLMMPLSIDFQNIPKEVLLGDLIPATPLQLRHH